MGPGGLEPSPKTPGFSRIPDPGGAESGALPDDPTPGAGGHTPADLDDLVLADDANPLDDPDLERLVNAWADLAEPIKRGIVALLDAACGNGKSRR